MPYCNMIPIHCTLYPISYTIYPTPLCTHSAMQNLREAIAGYRGRLVHEGNEGKRTALLMVALEYLQRYYVLIEFAAYIGEPSFDPLAPGQLGFGEWLAARPELRRYPWLKTQDVWQGTVIRRPVRWQIAWARRQACRHTLVPGFVANWSLCPPRVQWNCTAYGFFITASVL